MIEQSWILQTNIKVESIGIEMEILELEMEILEQKNKITTTKITRGTQ